EDVQVGRRHIGQRVGPVFEHAFVDALGLAEIRAPIIGDAGPEDMVVAALDDVDGVDLNIAEMGERIGDGLRTCAERGGHVEPERAHPEAPGLKAGQWVEFAGGRHRPATLAGFAGLPPSFYGFGRAGMLPVETSGWQLASPRTGASHRYTLPVRRSTSQAVSSVDPSSPT